MSHYCNICPQVKAILVQIIQIMTGLGSNLPRSMSTQIGIIVLEHAFEVHEEDKFNLFSPFLGSFHTFTCCQKNRAV